ncbi:Nucleoporin [Teratosphaeria destructans]|uniref:Nucleoporin n=1 Tax=Teratosphaeria destructans TaxID=418781 RepID=A0A9W7SMC7_9PEZI|nr:Nucleoporin [Teratosphaeria destructans]
MAPTPILFTKTALQPVPASPSHILEIDSNGSPPSKQLLARAGSKRGHDEISGLDEEQYARKHLATDGGVFFRSKARTPRSFAWRVLDDRKTLEVQNVDLVKTTSTDEGASWLTFRLSFGGAAALRNGIAFADAVGSDALDVYVLTEAKELLAFTLKRDLLTRGSVPDNLETSAVVKRWSSSSLSFRHPWRIHAVSSLEVVVALADGGLLRLTRHANENGSQWHDSLLSEGGWGGALTLRKLNPLARRQTVRHGDLDLALDAVVDLAKSPDGKYLWTVSLDHWLRAWNTETGKVVAKHDLLGEEVDGEAEKKRQQYAMGGQQGRLLQIVQLPKDATDGDEMAVNRADDYCIVLHSPKDHQIKFYRVHYTLTAGEEGVRCEDLQPRTQLVPPVDQMMNTNIWYLEDFCVQPGVEWFGSRLWLRARSGAVCRVFNLTFDLLDQAGALSGLREQWQSGWVAVSAGSSTTDELRLLADFPGDLDYTSSLSSTPTEKWLAFIFYPGRFSLASIETALHIYRKGRGLQTASSMGLHQQQEPLLERLTSSITSKVLLRRGLDDQPDYDRFQQDIQAQWHTFYSLLSHLHNRRHESVGFAFDAEDGLLWHILADFVAPVRALSGLEKHVANIDILSRSSDPKHAVENAGALYGDIYQEQMVAHDETKNEGVYLSRLLSAARELRRSLSPSARSKLAEGAAIDALVFDSESQAGRAAAMFERAGFDSEVSDEDYDALQAAVECLGGIGALTDDHLMAILGWLELEGTEKGLIKAKSTICSFGVKTTVEIARETLDFHRNIILDLLALVVFMSGAFEQDELEENFNAEDMYEHAMMHLRRTELLSWLAKSESESTQIIPTSAHSDQEAELTTRVTLLEDIFIGDWKFVRTQQGHLAMAEAITASAKAWSQGIDLRDWDGITGHMLSFLLKHKEVELAQDFLRFTTGETAWSSYLRGRLHISTGQYAQATIDLKAAAEVLSSEGPMDTANFLAADERNYFGSGHAEYFQHVAALFERCRAWSYVADCAGLALEHAQWVPNFAQRMAEIDSIKNANNSPAQRRMQAGGEEVHLLKLMHTRNEILGRLFTALRETGRWREAYEALAKIVGPPLQRSNLKKLIDGMIKQGDAVPELLALPFEGQLAIEADKVLAEAAKKNLAARSSGAPTAVQILYAFRAQRSDFRGAAEILYEHLQDLRTSQNHRRAVQDPEDETLPQLYVLLINTLACAGEDEAYLLAQGTGLGAKRRLVTLDELRREYAVELDKRSDMLHGRYALVGDESMDVL